MEIAEIDHLPSSIQTEITVIGAMIRDGIAISDATARLQPHDFLLDSHQRIYRSIVEMVDKSEPVDLITLSNHMEAKGELDAIGNSSYLAYLTEGIPRNPNIESYVKIVKEKSGLRRLTSICNDGLVQSMDHSSNFSDVLAAIEADLADAAQGAVAGGFVTMSDIILAQPNFESFMAGDSTEGTIATGFALDKWTRCFKPGELIIIGARPAMGKTALALNIATNSGLRFGKKVGILSLEMSKEELIKRMVQSEARIPRDRYIAGINADERKRHNLALEAIMDSAIRVDDKPFTTMQEIRAKARRLNQAGNLDLLIIDYLGLIEAPARSENRTQEVSAMSRGLKGLAKELGIPVICLAQLNRKCEERPNKRPMLSDLRDSGSIEQDADDVLFLYRHEVYEPGDASVRGTAELIVAKQRGGRVGTLNMMYAGEITQFTDAAYPDQENYHG